MSNFSFKKVEIENFRSIEKKVTLDIKPGLFCIEGINADEPGSHNGAGKSSLISAIYWCITGNALTNEILADEVINLKTGKNCKVTLYIESSAGNIKIVRTRKDSELGNNLLLFIDEQDLTCHKVAETQERINKLLGIPFELLHSTLMMTHDMKSAFSELSPQQRIQTLESIRDYSIWDKVREEANKDIKTYNKKLTETHLEVSNLTGSLSTYINMKERAQNAFKQLQDSTNINSLKDTVSSIEKNIQTTDAFISKKEAELAAVQSITIKTDSELTKQLSTLVESANDDKNAIQKAEFEIKTLEREKSLIEKWFKNDKCPTCGKPLDRTEAEILEKNTALAKYNEDILMYQKEIDTLNTSLVTKRKKWSETNSELQVSEKKVKEKNDKERLLTNEIQRLVNEKHSLETRKLTLINEINSFDEKLKKAEEAVSVHDKDIAELEEKIKTLESEIDVYENKKQLSDYFYKLLGSKGELRPYLLNKDIRYMNACMQKYIACFFQNTDVSLQLNGASIEIVITANGMRKSISSLSGGEKKRVNLAIQFSLYDLMKTASQSKFSVIFLDEIEAQLDSLACQQLIELIEDKADEIESVYWISNSDMVKQNIVNKIICTKKCGRTEVTEQCGI